MPLYESTLIIRQDLSMQEVEKLTATFSKVITDNNGEIVKTEQWGLRDLAYPIKKFTKGYYAFLGINASNEAMKEMERKAKINEDVIRCVTFKVEKISESQSPIITIDDEGGEEIVIGDSDKIDSTKAGREGDV